MVPVCLAEAVRPDVASPSPPVWVRCQCCRAYPQILARIVPDGILIRGKRFDTKLGLRVDHELLLTPDRLHGLALDQKLYCDCCLAADAKKILAEFADGLLIIRAHRHGKPHFVALSATRLHTLLAASSGS